MEKKLSISYIQYDIVWEAPKENLQIIESILPEDIDTDILILPEMFSTGFSMNPAAMAETMSESTVQWMIDLANRIDALVIGSIIIKEQANYYNRLLTCYPDGKIHYYNKKHLFGEDYEQKEYTAGNDILITEYKGWKICPLICYDLRFPVWSRNTQDYDLLIYIASWPETRVHHWNTLLKARAIENQSYVVGVNRIGHDGLRLDYKGYSQLISYDGQILQHAQEKQGIFHTIIDDNHLTYRSKLNFLKDREKFTMN
jgi:predicted amidohydrolase